MLPDYCRDRRAGPAAAGGSLSGAWVSSENPCYLSSVGVVCNGTRMLYPNGTRYDRFEPHKFAIWCVPLLIDDDDDDDDT